MQGPRGIPGRSARPPILSKGAQHKPSPALSCQAETINQGPEQNPTKNASQKSPQRYVLQFNVRALNRQLQWWNLNGVVILNQTAQESKG